MHSLKNSIAKRLYTWRRSSDRCAKDWSGQYWQEQDGIRAVSCAHCRKFNQSTTQCSVPYGSPVRKCVTSAQEANLNSLYGKDLLEIGFGKHSIPKRLVTDVGGTWTGIEPKIPESQKAKFGRGGHGYVGNIPFSDATFHVVAGIQSIEHWAQSLPDPTVLDEHTADLKEVHRVLKPNGWIYFCAPIHLHGHEIFVADDIPQIRALFDPLLWKNLTIEKWREDYTPLERFPTPEGDWKSWSGSIKNYPPELLEDIRINRSVHLITIKADKRD